MPQQANASLATIRVGGRDYPAVVERTCHTCASPYRHRIETEVVAGRSWRAIADALPPDAGLHARNLRDHFANQHLPVVNEVVQRLTEQQAEQRGEIVAAGAEQVVDHLAFAQSVIGRVNARVATGEIEPNVGDGLRAADLLAKHHPGPTMAEADYATALGIYASAARAVMTDDQHREFSDRLDDDSVLQDLAQRWEEMNSHRRVG
jgi:hypothetical protein